MLGHNGAILRHNTKWLGEVILPPPKPGHMLVRVNDGNPPTDTYLRLLTPHCTYETATLVPGTTDIYDVYKSGNDFERLLFGCENVVEIISANTSHVVNMKAMCEYCFNLGKTCLFDTHNVTSMYRMFDCYEGDNPDSKRGHLESVPLFDTSNVTRMTGFLASQRNITTLPQFDTHNVTEMIDMCYLCTSLVNVPVLDISSCTSLFRTFRSCRSLVEFPAWDCSTVQNMAMTFGECDSLRKVNVYNTQNVTTMQQLFVMDTNFVNMPTFEVDSLTDVASMFDYCSSMPSGILDMYNRLDALGSQVTDHIYCFRNCGRNSPTGSAELSQIPSDWK